MAIKPMNNFSVRGMPVVLDLLTDGTASKTDARDTNNGGPRPAGARLFFFQNLNPFYVWLRDSSLAVHGEFQPAERFKRWLLPPHSTSDIFWTQNPDWMSVLPDNIADIPAFGADGLLLFNEPVLVHYGN